MRKKKQAFNKGITLIALVITIIVLLILAGVSITTLIGEGGILNKATTAKNSNNQATIEEEIKLAYNAVQMDAITNGWDFNKKAEELKKELDRGLGEKEEKSIVLVIESNLSVSYKGYEVTIYTNGEMEMEDSTKERPNLIVTSLNTEAEADYVRIKVVATTNDGEIETIESLNEMEIVENTSNSEKTFETKKNGIYYFKAKGTNGRTTKKEIEIRNILEKKDSLLQAISEIKENGEVVVAVEGKTSTGTTELKNYSLNVIYSNQDLVLDGETPIVINNETITPTNKSYEFGQNKDVGTTSTNATNTVVLKVEGDLKVEAGVTLTSISNNYGGPKGMIIYCTGTLTNNGTISMTGKGAKANGENVYLWRNLDGSFEYIPAQGGEMIAEIREESATNGNIGKNASTSTLISGSGVKRATAGGGTGGVAAQNASQRPRQDSSTGGVGTSYGAGGWRWRSS